MPIDQTIDTLTDTDYAQNVGFVAGGFAAAAVLGNVFERFGPDLPNEAYGVASIAASTFALSGTDRKYAAAGGGVYIVDQLGRRFGVRQTVLGMGA
jgi:hypothetical protein